MSTGSSEKTFRSVRTNEHNSFRRMTLLSVEGTNQAMECFDKSRLHTEAKENRRKPRQQAGLSSSNNHGDDGNLVDSVHGTVDGNHGTYSSTDTFHPFLSRE